MLKKFYNDEAGFVISLELVIIMTLVICTAAVGWSAVRVALVQELNDLAQAIGVINQSYLVPGIRKDLSGNCGGCAAYCNGFKFQDQVDSGDLEPITIVCNPKGEEY